MTSRRRDALLAGVFAGYFVSACSSDGCSGGSAQRASPSGDPSAPASASSTPVHPPPTGPAALGKPRAFHFVAPLADKPNAIVLLEGVNRTAAAGWIAPSAEVDGYRSVAAGLLVDEAKLPEALRLRGLVVHVYAEDKLLCDGTLGAARVGAVGDSVMHLDDTVRDPTKLLGGAGELVLLFAVDMTDTCAEQLQPAQTRVAWVRDASLPSPVIVGKPESAKSAAVQSDVRKAVRLVRATPAFARAQRSADVARIAHGLPPMPLELQWREEWAVPPSWMRFSWNGAKRAYLSFVVDCPPPWIRVGYEFRETATGAFELLPTRSAVVDDPVGLEVVDPVVLVDVDADGRLEVIEAGELAYRLRSFDGTEWYASLSLDHCR